MKFLICLDYSKAAEIILKEAIVYCKAFPQAEIFAYNIVDGSFIAEGSEYETLQNESTRLKKIAEKAFDGKQVNFNIEVGNPADRIIAYSKRINCDLLILGTHGRTGINRLMIGSVAETVIRNVSCNTLVIPMKHKI